VDRAVAGITFGIFSFALLLVQLPIAFAGSSRLRTLLLLGGWLLITVALACRAFFWPPVRYRHVAYRLDERGLTIRRGVFWHSVASVPRSRVQHTDVSQGPIERAFGLATLVVHTAGTQNASVALGGLSRETAFRMRDDLLDVGEEDAV